MALFFLQGLERVMGPPGKQSRSYNQDGWSVKAGPLSHMKSHGVTGKKCSAEWVIRESKPTWQEDIASPGLTCLWSKSHDNAGEAVRNQNLWAWLMWM